MGEIPIEKALELVTQVQGEVGLIVGETSGFHKILGPQSNHLIYIQKSKKLGLINTTLPLPQGEPGTRPLKKDNGSVTCHIEPDLAHLERFLRMLADPGTAKLERNKPRPFAATKAPAPRQPKPVVVPVPMSQLATTSEPDDDDPRPLALKMRLAEIAASARRGRIRRWEEEGFDHKTACAIADGEITADDAREHLEAKKAVENRSDTIEGFALETGIEISQ